MRFQKRLLYCCISVLLLTALAAPLDAETLPRLDGETLSGKRIVLPDNDHGKIAFLLIGFSRRGGDATRAWEQRLNKDFGTDQKYVIHPVAVLEDAPRFIRGIIKSGIRRGTPLAEQDRFVILVNGEADLKRFVGYSASDDAYLLLIDGNGEVRWRGHGAFTEEKYSALRDAAGKLAT